jgi:hypothetical protein
MEYVIPVITVLVSGLVVRRLWSISRATFSEKYSYAGIKKRLGTQEHTPSPLWDWAPWIVVTVGATVFVVLLIMGMEFVLALCCSATFVLGGVKAAAILYGLLRTDDVPPE